MRQGYLYAKRWCSAIFWWFSARVVLVFVRSVDSSSLGWVKSAVCWLISLISSSKTLCINSSSQERNTSYGMLDKLVGKFMVDSTYSELPPLSPELAAGVISTSRSVGNLGVASGPSVVINRRWCYNY